MILCVGVFTGGSPDTQGGDPGSCRGSVHLECGSQLLPAALSCCSRAAQTMQTLGERCGTRYPSLSVFVLLVAHCIIPGGFFRPIGSMSFTPQEDLPTLALMLAFPAYCLSHQQNLHNPNFPMKTLNTKWMVCRFLTSLEGTLQSSVKPRGGRMTQKLWAVRALPRISRRTKAFEEALATILKP